MKITRQIKSLTVVAGVFAVLSAGLSTPSAQAKGDKGDKKERKEERKERKEERKDRREDRRDDRPEPGHTRPGHGTRPGNGNYNPGYGHPRPRPGGVVGSRGYTGEVLNVVSANRVDVRINGRLYNVYLISRLPRGLNRGDIVRIDGVRQGGNDIRQARLQIIRNR